jgi:hypothetical protein
LVHVPIDDLSPSLLSTIVVVASGRYVPQAELTLARVSHVVAQDHHLHAALNERGRDQSAHSLRLIDGQEGQISVCLDWVGPAEGAHN